MKEMSIIVLFLESVEWFIPSWVWEILMGKINTYQKS